MAITRIKNNQITDLVITNVKIASGTLTGDKMNNNLTFNSNLVLNGNLTVTGNVTAVQSTTTQITDPLLTLGLGNAGTSFDLGLVLIRGSGGNRFIGWKENQGAFVFINTTEDGLTTGNIATTAYGNLVFGNATALGATTLGGFTISGNTLNSTGAMTIRSDAGTVTVANTLVGLGAVNLGSTLSVFSTATVNALTSNGAIQGTTGGFSSNLTGAALTVNGSATIGTTLGVTGNINGSGATLTGSIVTTGAGQHLGGLQATPIGNAATSTALFTTVGASGNVTANALTVNNNATVGGTLGVTSNIAGSSLTLTGSATVPTLGVSGNATIGNASVIGTITVNSITIAGGIQNTPIGNAVASTGQFTTLSATGNITGAGLTSNGSITAITTISGLGGLQATPIGNAVASTGQFTTVSATGNVTGAALTSNGSITAITTISGLGGLQATPIGNVTPSTALFTSVGSSGNVTTSALTVNNSATIGTTLGVTGNATIGNVSTTALGASGIVTITNATDATGASTGALQVTGGASVNKNLYVTGNIYAGNIIAIQANTLSVQDPLLYLTANSIFPYNYSIGFYSQYQGGNPGNVNANIYQHTGFVRDNTDGTWKLFSNVVAEPGITVDFTNAQYDQIRVGNTIVSGTLSVSGGTTYTGNITVNGLTVNTSAVVGTTLQALGGIQNTPIGNVTPSTALFTTVGSSGNTTVSALTVNGSATVGSTLGVVGNINGTGATLSGSIVTTGAGQHLGGLQATPIGNASASTGQFTTVSATGNITGAALTVNGSATIGTTLGVTGNINGTSATLTGSATIGTTLGVTGNINGTSATLTGSATIGTTLGVTGNINGTGITLSGSLVATGAGNFNGGLQSTPIGNASASTGAFTTITSTGTIIASGNIVANSGTASTGSTTGALVVIGGAGIAGTLNVQTAANLGNVTFSNTTISSNITNTGLTINPNGTGTTTFNSGLNDSRTVIQGTTANTFVVTGSQIGVNTATPTTGTVIDFATNNSIMLPKGTTAARPSSPVIGMFRFSTTSNLPEWYDGSAWNVPSTNFTIVTANTQTGNGSATSFTIPIANATTAGTIVSINGVVQEPTAAYSIAGNVVTFTEAPASTDTIDFRVFVTTTQVTTITDAAGTTGLFYDLPAAGSQITTFRTAGNESFSIQANSEARFTGNIMPSANVTYGLGSNSRRWKDLWLSGTTLYMGNIVIKETAGNTIAFFGPDGTTPAVLSANGSSLIGVDATSITAGTSNVKVYSSSNIAVTVGGTANTVVFSSTAITHSGSILPSANGSANIGSTVLQYNTIHAKATSAQYADLAENYASDDVYPPGTVLEFGGVSEVTLASNATARVAGVVSTNPAYLMNSAYEGAGKVVSIALQGRVPCLVKGQVRKGDMMISAGNGYARADANPKMGTVIGKSLENFDGTEGVIEVVIGRL